MRSHKGYANRAKSGDKASIAHRREKAVKAKLEKRKSRPSPVKRKS